MRIKVSGYLDTESRELVIERATIPKQSGRKPDPPAKLAARILADAWATTNFTRFKLPKADRTLNALGHDAPKDNGSLRRAIRNAKERAASLFAEPHLPGDIFYGRIGAIWFSDRATRYESDEAIEIVGFAWVWQPSQNHPNAVWTIAKAELPKDRA